MKALQEKTGPVKSTTTGGHKNKRSGRGKRAIGRTIRCVVKKGYAKWSGVRLTSVEDLARVFSRDQIERVSEEISEERKYVQSQVSTHDVGDCKPVEFKRKVEERKQPKGARLKRLAATLWNPQYVGDDSNLESILKPLNARVIILPGTRSYASVESPVTTKSMPVHRLPCWMIVSPA